MSEMYCKSNNAICKPLLSEVNYYLYTGASVSASKVIARKAGELHSGKRPYKHAVKATLVEMSYTRSCLSGTPNLCLKGLHWA